MKRSTPLKRKTKLVAKKGLTRSGALARRTPMPKATTEIRRRVAVRKRNDKRRPAHLASAQREGVVVERAQGRCEFLIVATGEACGSTERVQAVHIARRWKHSFPVDGNPAVYSEDCAFAGCEVHHKLYDARRYRGVIAIPVHYRLAAFVAIRDAESARVGACKAVARVDLSELLPLPGIDPEDQFTVSDEARARAEDARAESGRAVVRMGQRNLQH